MFRIDRESILAAAEAGLTPDDIVGTLRRASSRELPANVERQITDWLGAVRHVSMRRALIIRCPDAATAAKVRSAGGKHIRMLTDTVLESTAVDSAARKTLLLKLRKLGIFVEAGTSESADV